MLVQQLYLLSSVCTESPNVERQKKKKKLKCWSGGGMRGWRVFGSVLELEQGSTWLQLLGVWVCSGISRLADEQGPPICSDVTNSSREFLTFLFLAVVRSFPENWGEKNSRIIFWSIWEQREEEAKKPRLKTHGGLSVSLALAPLCWFSSSRTL